MSKGGIVIYSYMSEMMKRDATDLYLTVGVPPTLRISNKLVAISDSPLLEEHLDAMTEEILTPRQLEEFHEKMEQNLALDMGKEGRFRVNVLRQRQKTAMVLRKITSEIPNFDELNLPKTLEALSLEKRGLILLVGATSSGKSTSLAAMIDYRNTNVGGHIVTIEDPIEYYHEHKKGIVTQREIGIDTESFQVAVKNALRQKPDVILVGEIRDAEVMDQAIAAAETGHLCYATLHTTNAAQCIDRIINFFSEERADQIRLALAMNLRAVIAQRLIRTTDGGMACVVEIMLNEALIKDLILKGETTKIRAVMANNNPIGMITFDQSVFNIYKEGRITAEKAIDEAELPTEMKMRIQEDKMVEGGGGAMGDIDTSGLSL